MKMLMLFLFIATPTGAAYGQTAITGQRLSANVVGTIHVESAIRSRILPINPVDRPFEVHPPQPGPTRRSPLSERLRSPAPAVTNKARTSGASSGIVPSLVASFPALGDNNSSIPPDTHGAVGPNHVMVTLNTEVRIQDRNSSVISTVALSTFWDGFFDRRPFDPKILYDHMSARWMFTVMADPAFATSSVLIAVSQTSDPTGFWDIYRVDADASNLGWADYPSIGYNKDWIVIQVNMFTVSGSDYTGSNIYVFDKGDLYSGGSGLFTLFQDFSGGFSQVPAISYDDTLSTMYLIENWTGNEEGQGLLRLTTISGPVGGEVYTQDVAFIPSTEVWADDPPHNNFAPQAGSSTGVMTNDARMQNAVNRNGSIWGTHTIFLPESAPTRSAVQWWEISPLGSVIQRGRIDDTTGNRYYAFPSIAVNESDDALIGYSRFASDQFVSANYAFRAGGDPLNVLQDDTVLKEGEAKYVKMFGSGRNRWGDYSNTVVDPLDDSSFWTIQQYAEEPEVNSPSTDRWGTWWGHIAPVPGTPAISTAPGNLEFGFLGVGEEASQIFWLQNLGTADLEVGRLTLNVGPFAISDTSAFAAVGDSVALLASFSPEGAGVFADTIRVESNDPIVPVIEIPIFGKAVLRGDLDESSSFDIFDVIRLVRIIVGTDPTPSDELPLFHASDLNGDLELNVLDVVLQINMVLDIVTRPVAVTSVATQIYLSLEAPVIMPTGNRVIPVIMNTNGSVAGLQADLVYDSRSVGLAVPEIASNLEGFAVHAGITQDKMRIVVYSLEGKIVPAGRHLLAYLPLRVIRDDLGNKDVRIEGAVISDSHAKMLPFEYASRKVNLQDLPPQFSLGANAPNPFNPTTQIVYHVPIEAHIELTIYNALGQEVARIVDDVHAPGRYAVNWKGTNARGESMASGVYLYRLTADSGFQESRRMLLLK